jgi:seryl-tRNA synthetase
MSDNNFNTQVSDAITSLFNLTTRIDEKVKAISESSRKADEKFDLMMENQNDLIARVIKLEAKENVNEKVKELEDKLHKTEVKVSALELVSKGYQHKVNRVIDAAMKFFIILASAILIYKLGL